MAISVSVGDVEEFGSGIWKARLSPDDLRILGTAESQFGSRSVLLVLECADFDPDNRTLAFNPSAARLLNLGTSEDVLIVESAANEVSHQAEQPSLGVGRLAPGDSRFLGGLPSELRELGGTMLRAVRAQFAGDLKYFERSGKFVETPDNFWTVRIQPRDSSLRITVRGRPEGFDQPLLLALKPDMTGYSSFKSSSATQIPDFLKVLCQVRRKDRLTRR